MVSTMRIAQSQLLAAFILSATGIVSIFRSILYLPNHDRNVEYDMQQLGLSSQHYAMDERLKQKYTTTHENLLRGKFSLQLNDENGEDGDNNIQHRGILRVGSEKLGKWPRVRHHPQNYTFLVGDELARVHGIDYAKFVDDKRVVVYVNDTILPLVGTTSTREEIQQYNGTSRLCNLLHHMTRRESLEEIPPVGIPPVVLNIDGDCKGMNDREGQGNWVLSLFGIRVASAMAKIDLSFRCYVPIDDTDRISPRKNRVLEEKAEKLQSVFPWFASHHTAPSLSEPWPYAGSIPTESEICRYAEKEGDFLPVEKMAKQMRSDVRRMAVTLLGSDATSNRIHPLVPLDATPWISNVDMNDVVIYVPCHEDALAGSGPNAAENHSAGLVQFAEYTRLIDKGTRSIGIIAQRDSGTNGWCSKAAQLLEDYLRNHYTASSASSPVISTHDNDSLPLQYARMTMAKQAFGSFSAFPLIPIIGTFGRGYYFEPLSEQQQQQQQSHGVAATASSIFQRVSAYPGFENLHFVSGKSLSAQEVQTKSWDEISKWLTAS